MAYLPGKKKRKEKQPEREEKYIRRQPRNEDDDRLDIDLEKLKKAYEDLEAAHRQIRESHIEMILNLAIAAEYKDPDTGNHILRISDYATEVAKAINLSEEDTDILRYSSPMHDIGKIGIPDRILQKPGKLTADEWEIMKQHTLIGARMFQSSKAPLLKAAAQIAQSHHEWFDGNGYPYGLKGEEIPLFGRIVGMVDVFDAVVSERCYKNAFSFLEGMEFIKKLAGTHLDPELVEVFIKMKDRVREIYDANTSIQQFVKEFESEKPDLG